MEYRLQPLRVPTGWTVSYNDLREIDPLDVAENDWHFILKQDLLQMEQKHFNRMLDVGWYFEGDHFHRVEGEYGLVVHEGDFRGRLLFEFRTPDRMLLVAEVERLLLEVCEGRL